MPLPSAFPKTASRKKFSSACLASGVNRSASRAASGVWARRRRKRVGVICYADHLGTPRAITKSSDNSKVWEWKNDSAFGDNLPNENPSGLGNFEFNLGFPGMYRDKETGTFYNFFRDYDPRTGRYVQSDPIGLGSGDLNTYGYVRSAPLGLVDPLGLWPICKVTSYGAWAASGGPYKKNDASSKMFSGFETKVDGGDGSGGPSPSAPDGSSPWAPKICATLKIRFTIFEVFYVNLKYDLFQNYARDVGYECTNEECGKTTTNFYTLPEIDPRILQNVSKSEIQREPWKSYMLSMPNPVCLPGPRRPTQMGR